jgi:hypothetical protein
MASNRYTVAEIDQLKAELAARPELDPSKRRLSKQQAVERLYDEIVVRRLKGEGLADLADWLSERGLEINAWTLSQYLGRARRGHPSRANPETPAPKYRDGPGGEVTAPRPDAAGTGPEPPGVARSRQAAAVTPPGSSTSPTERRSEAAVSRESSGGKDRWRITVREDTEKI